MLQIFGTNGTAFPHALMAADERAAEAVRRQGCPCGGALHQSNYPRKPRGLPSEYDALFQTRFSFCCARDGCRRRRTPPSVRFLGRRVYVGLIVLLCSAERLQPVEADVPRRTVGRWRTWFASRFVESRFWQSARALFMPPVVESALPRSLLEQFVGERAAAVRAALAFLSPITTTSVPGSPLEWAAIMGDE